LCFPAAHLAVRGAESASRRRPKDCAKPPALTAVFRIISHEGTKTRRLAHNQTPICFRDVKKKRILPKSKMTAPARKKLVCLNIPGNRGGGGQVGQSGKLNWRDEMVWGDTTCGAVRTCCALLCLRAHHKSSCKKKISLANYSGKQAGDR
jgi:hypothetical protein